MRILFVDDEPNILEGLRRSLRGFRDEWDMRFVEGGHAALAVLEAEPADVVVSDMRMPGMEGDALLAEVRKRWPQAVRIVLTGECTRDAMLRVSGLAHRILNKPCNPLELQAAVSQASSLVTLLQCPILSAALGRLKSVPSTPEFSTRILNTLGDPNSTAVEIGNLCIAVIGASVNVLQEANSAGLGGRHAVTTALQALQKIETQITKALVITAGGITQFDPSSLHPYSISDLWSHSQAVATLVREIAARETCGGVWTNMATLAGISHDIGCLLLASTNAKACLSVLQQVELGKITLVEAEKRLHGISHAEIGAYLLGLWRLLAAILEAVACHHSHSPAASHVGQFSPVTALHPADSILAPDEGGGPNMEYLSQLGLDDRLPVWVSLANDLHGGCA